MSKKCVVVCVSLAAGTLLVALLLAANSAPVSAAPPRPTVPDAPARPADAVTSWSSGWVALAPGNAITLPHNLGGDPDDYHVEMWFLDLNNGYGINTAAYGGAEDNGQWVGAAWQNLTANSITILRHAADSYADRIRVRIWIPDPPPGYCTAWGSISAGTSITIVHTLGGDADDLTTDLMFRSAANGINQRAYGGLEYGGGANFVGAHWYNLNDSTVNVYRNAQDEFVEQMRMCVTVADPPAYDSGWVDHPAGTMVFTHSLGGSPLLYRVRLDAWNAGIGINHYLAGGEMVNVTPSGTYWSNLTDETISVENLGGEQRVRVRIWTTYPIYLPVIMRNYSPPTELGYDDGSFESFQSWQAPYGFAVRFTTPGASAHLVGARFYFATAVPGNPVEVHVWDAGHNDLITPFNVAPTVNQGWLDVDLSSANLTVSGDFYIGFLYVTPLDPSLAVDSSSNSGRSYEVPWSPMNYNYGIRALLTP